MIIETIDFDKIGKNGVLIVKSDDFEEISADFFAVLKKRVPAETMVLMMPERMSLEAVSEEEMNKAGWYRREVSE